MRYRSPDCSNRKQRIPSTNTTMNKNSPKELPRKIAKIRRTFPEPGVEKTELRFVLYSEPTGKYKRENFLREVADFFNEQAKCMIEQDANLPLDSSFSCQQKPPVRVPQPPPLSSSEIRKTNKSCVSKYPTGKATPEPDVTLVRDARVKETHHNQNCPRARALRASLPVIKKLIGRIREISTHRNGEKLNAILSTAEQCYEDAELCLSEGGPIGEQICDRIMRLNLIAGEFLSDNPARQKIVTERVSSSTSISNVNAVSDIKSDVNTPRHLCH